MRRRLEKENKMRPAFRDLERYDLKRDKLTHSLSPLALFVVFGVVILSIVAIVMARTNGDGNRSIPVVGTSMIDDEPLMVKVKHNFTNDGTNHPVVLVTGASNNHFDALFYVFLPSVFSNTSSVVEDRNLIVIFYDLGLKKEQDALLRQTFPQVVYRQFRTDKYPTIYEAVGEDQEDWKLNAWKPIIMNQVAKEFRQRFLMREQVAANTARKKKTATGIATTTTATTTTTRQPAYLFWMDAGCLFPTTEDNFNQLIDYVHEKSLWSPFSGGTVHDWVHHDMVSYMGLDMNNTVGDWEASSGLVGLNIMDNRLVDDILIPWMACALVRDCIAPPPGIGTEIKLHHRQDQAALTLLMHIHGYEITHNWFDVGHHQEDTPNVREAKRVYRESHPDGQYWRMHLD